MYIRNTGVGNVGDASDASNVLLRPFTICHCFLYFLLLFNTCSLSITKIRQKQNLDVPFRTVSRGSGSPRVSSQKVQRRLEKVREG